MNDVRNRLSTCLLATTALFACVSSAFAADPQLTGAASKFALLSAAPGGAGAVTCSNSVVTGDVGSSGASASVAQSNCSVAGTVVAPVSADVLSDFDSAYAKFANVSCANSLNAGYAGTLTLTPGVYCSSAGVAFASATLTLDAQGDPNAVWVLKIGSGGIGALTGTVALTLANGAQASNVYWWVADAVSVSTTGFQGTLLAGGAVSMTGSAGSARPVNGSVLAKSAVALTNVAVTGAQAPGGGAKSQSACNQGVGNGTEGCDPANSNQGSIFPFGSNDENGGVPGSPGRKGGNQK